MNIKFSFNSSYDEMSLRKSISYNGDTFTGVTSRTITQRDFSDTVDSDNPDDPDAMDQGEDEQDELPDVRPPSPKKAKTTQVAKDYVKEALLFCTTTTGQEMRRLPIG